MEEEVKNETPEMNANDFVEQLNQLKQSTVSKEEYERVLADRKKLADTLISRPYQPDVEEEEPAPDVDALRKKFFSKHKNDYEMIKSALALRSAILATGGTDPFAGNNPENLNPTNLAEYERIATAMQEAVDAAHASGDDPLVFRSELRRRFPY